MLTSFGRHFYFAVCIILMLTLPLASNASGSKPTQTYKYSYVPGMLIVKFNPFVCSGVSATNAAQSLQMKYGILKSEPAFNTQNLKKKIGVEELERVFVMSVSLVTDVRELAKRMTNEPNVEYAEPNYIIPVDKVPNDPLYSNVYPLSIVKASQAWDVLTGDSTVVVAILDTGTDWDHPDLTASIWQNKNEIPNNNIDDDNNGFKDDIRGWDFVHNPGNVWPGEDSLNADNNPMDFDGHGTHTAGIAGATTNNGVGIASLSWGIKVMPLRIGWRGGDGNGYGSTYWMSQAFIYAANNGASVANLSFGTSPTAVEGAQYA